jgi:hypothetical protein
MAKPTQSPDKIERNRAASRKYSNRVHSERSPAERLEKVWRDLAAPARPRPDSANSQVLRKVALARSHMPWSDREECYRMYMAAYILSEHLGQEYVVDHSVPLTSPFVCGFHTHHNLQVIKATQNRIKSNNYWPEMWPIGWEAIEFLEEFSKYSIDSSQN